MMTYIRLGLFSILFVVFLVSTIRKFSKKGKWPEDQETLLKEYKSLYKTYNIMLILLFAAFAADIIIEIIKAE